VNISKITPPRLPHILDRPRLLNLLEKNRDRKLILILGQAAQGKSTLAASYAKALKIPSPWVNLDKEDSDPVNLYHLMIQSLQHALKNINLLHLLSDPPQLMGPREEIPLYQGWAQSIFKEVSIPIQIVMDGLDRLSTAAHGFKFLQVLVEESPPNIHLILLSREIPPPVLEFQHLKIGQQALVLTNEDLAFTQDEVKEFFKKVRRISLNADQLKRIYSATEGWIGALILLAEFLGRIQESTREKFISEDFPAHFKNEIFQYFGKEIFSSLSTDVQEFLIKSSLIDLIEPAFVETFIGMESTQETLREHARRNLFVHSYYDEKKGWLFQYHHLFRDFLRAKFMTSLGHEEQKSLLLRAGTLYAQRGELENSVKYLLDAKAYTQAASVIERLGMDLLQNGRINDLSKWLSVLPEDIIQDSSWLLFYLAMTKRFRVGAENLIGLQKAYTAFRQQGDMKGTLISLGELIERSVQTGIHLVPIEELIEAGEAALQQLESNEYPYERTVLWYSIGVGRILGEGDIRKAIWACENAYSIAKQLKNVSLQAYALSFSALGLVLLGEFSLAEKGLEKVEKIAEKSVHPEFRAIELTVRCLLANHRGEFGKAEVLVQKLQDEVEKHGFAYMVPWTFEISGYLRAAQGELSEAERIGKQYLSTALSVKNSFFKGLAYRLLGLVYLHQKDFEKAREAINQGIHVFSSEAPSRYHFNRAKIELGLVCTHLKEYKRAEKAFDEALQYFSSISSHISLAEIHLATAFLLYDQRKNADATAQLRTGFKIAEDKKYEYFYNFGKEYLTKACLLALELKVEGAIDYAAHLLATRLSPVAEKDLKNLSNHPDSSVREKVWEIRRKIHRSKIPGLRIETLGGLQVFDGNSPIDEDQWDRIQPKQLLKAIVSHGGHSIPKEILIDELWPEESPKTAESNFKTTLQRLRKSLEPTIDKDFGSSYIHLHDNILFLDSELCDVDADRFVSILKMADEKEKRGDKKAALPLYTEAVEIYKGDFLPDETYISRVDKRREELKTKYIDLLNKMGRLHENQGAIKKAVGYYKMAIQADPLLEESYQKLMILYSSKGMYSEALRTYEDCKKTLKKELKSRPDETTDAIYKKIMEKITTPRPPARKGLMVERIREAKA
jgi:LuxR family maltose regulon positive regulatory protein